MGAVLDRGVAGLRNRRGENPPHGQPGLLHVDLHVVEHRPGHAHRQSDLGSAVVNGLFLEGPQETLRRNAIL
jgi:hypothetical protein